MPSERRSSDQSVEFSIDLHLDANAALPLRKQLGNELKQAILQVRLMPGQLLPSTRLLAIRLGVSRTTVLRAYEDLLCQGYLKSVDGVGTFVSENLPKQSFSTRAAPTSYPIHLSQYAKNLMAMAPTPLSSEDHPALNCGASPPELLPIKQWRQVLLKHCRDYNSANFDFVDEPFGNFLLRQAICGYLGRMRALQCNPSQVAVFSGVFDAPNMIAQILVDPGDSVIVENPGFSYIHQRFRSLGATVQGVSVDNDGIVVDELRKLPPSKLLYVTPSHQDPTGAVLSLSRRKDLLDWAYETGTIVVEDDHDCEHRYTGSRLPSLQGLDEHEQVIYLSSFWKTLFPLASGGYMVVPDILAPVFSHAIYMRQGAGNTSFPMLEQSALTEFINDGILERHIRKIRAIYIRRWQTLIAALTLHLRPHVSMAKESASMHLLVRFQVPIPDNVLMELAHEANFVLTSTSSFYLEAKPLNHGEFLVPFAHIAEQELERSVHDFAKLLKKTLMATT